MQPTVASAESGDQFLNSAVSISSGFGIQDQCCCSPGSLSMSTFLQASLRVSISVRSAQIPRADKPVFECNVNKNLSSSTDK